MLAFLAAACGTTAPRQEKSNMPVDPSATFAHDLALLRAHTKVVTLASTDGLAQIAIAPGYQGRVMTSTADGLQGMSFGYIHRAGVEAGARQPHMTVLGGEDRFWLGPEGGQFALYFPPGAAFDADHWQVPQPIDWDSWPIKTQTDRAVTFERDMTLTNYSGTTFSIQVHRTVSLLDKSGIGGTLGAMPGASTRVVAYESENRIVNTGTNTWTKETGLVSIWILGMYRPAPHTTVIVPFVPGPEAQFGPIVNDKYFGAIGDDRLRIGAHAMFFKADGQKRGKIGVPRPRARDAAGSYDPVAKVLTIVRFTLPQLATDYVNSMWEHQADPFHGDVVNSYNDGPLTPGAAPMGPFYEIESSSPAAALEPGESIQHTHRTFHLQGPEAELDAVARAVLGVSLSEIPFK
jgi:hypothetical protein